MTPASTATGPPRWAPDPDRRFDLRWYDGTRFTHHVAIRGIQGSSPPGDPPEAADVVATQMIDLLPAPAPPPPSTWGPVPPPPLHVPSSIMPPTTGWQPDLANARHLTPQEREQAALAAVRQRMKRERRRTAHVGWRLLAAIVDTLLSVLTLGVGHLVWHMFTATDAQSPGQRLLGLHVADSITHRRVSALRYVVARGLFPRLVVAVPLVLWVLYGARFGVPFDVELAYRGSLVLTVLWWAPVLVGTQRQAGHDLLSGTVVLRSP